MTSATTDRPPPVEADDAATSDRAGWSANGGSIRGLYLILVVLFGLISIGGLVSYNLTPHPANDFFAFDSFSRFIRDQSPASIYDQDLLRRFQNLPQHKLFAFMYHPGMMLLLWPLAHVPYDIGYALWIGLGLIACCAVVAGSREAWPLALLVVVAPSTLWTALCGQSTLLVTALLVGGLIMSPRRPLIAGILIGLATYKPQLGVLVPVALVAAGRWRTMAAAAATCLCIVIVSSVVFGADVWPSWVHHLSSIVRIRGAHRDDWAPVLATVGANLTAVGVGWRAAEAIQLMASIGAAACVWYCFRHRTVAADGCSERGDAQLQIAALAAATFLATPFAFAYDLPLFTASLLLFAAERWRCNGIFLFREVLALVAGFLLPYHVLVHWLHTLTSLVVLVVLCTILLRIRSVRIVRDREDWAAMLPVRRVMA